MADVSQIKTLVWTVIKHLSLLIICAAGYAALFNFSMYWYLFDFISTWYMPSGWMLGLLLLTRYRYWPTALLGVALANVIINFTVQHQPLFTALNLIFNDLRINALYYLLPLFIAHYFTTPWHKHGFLNNPKGIMAFFILVLTNQVGNVLQIAEWLPDIYQRADQFEVRMTYFLGGATGILLITPLMLVLAHICRYQAHINWPRLREGTLLWITATFITLLIYLWYPQTLYVLRALAFLAIIGMAYRYGWAGSLVMTLTINYFLAFTVFGESATQQLKDTQFYIFVYGMGGLLLGAVISQQRQLNLQLQQKNTELNQLAQRNRALAGKVVNVQEQERKTLSQELHDEVGQNITALQSELMVLEYQFPQIHASPTLRLVRDATAQIYQSVYHLLHWLRPRVLDEFGLHKTLTGNYFSQRLKQHGITYHSSVHGDLAGLPDNISIAVFRIVQEAVSNCIKHSNANCFTVQLWVEDTCLKMKILDDGQGVNAKAEPEYGQLGGFGLEGINDRVAALDGECQIDTVQGFIISLNIPLLRKEPVGHDNYCAD